MRTLARQRSRSTTTPRLDGLQRDGDETKPMRKIEFVDQEQATFNSMQREVFRARVYRLILCGGGSL